jgi:hypothetical protein
MIVLILFTLACPFLVAAFTKSAVLATAITFVSVHTMVMLNEVARDVEDPFHYDPNELPLPQIQYRMNERLLAVAKTIRPVAFTDVADLCGPSNIPHVKPVRLAALLAFLVLAFLAVHCALSLRLSELHTHQQHGN